MARITAKAFRLKMLKEFANIQKAFRRTVADKLGDKINDSIRKGKSPVSGGSRRLPKYSQSYTSAMQGSVKGTDGKNYSSKRPRPVNLTVSGDTLNSQKSKITSRGVHISYTKTVNGKNIAAIHNDGDGVPARRMLPDRNGEKFSREIQNDVLKIATLEMKKAATKLN